MNLPDSSNNFFLKCYQTLHLARPRSFPFSCMLIRRQNILGPVNRPNPSIVGKLILSQFVPCSSLFLLLLPTFHVVPCYFFALPVFGDCPPFPLIPTYAQDRFPLLSSVSLKELYSRPRLHLCLPLQFLQTWPTFPLLEPVPQENSCWLYDRSLWKLPSTFSSFLVLTTYMRE